MFEIPMNFAVSGQFTLRKRDVSTGEVTQEVGPFSNLITNLGLNRLATGRVLTNCYVGTGTVPPEVTDTNMSTFLVGTSTIVGNTVTAASAPNWVMTGVVTWSFAAGAISNNITEVGIGWAASPSNSIWSRELIVDSAGNPIAITILPTEILEVSYGLQLRIPQETFSSSFVLNGITYNYQCKASNAGGWILNPISWMTAFALDVAYRDATLSSTIAGTIGGTAIGGGANSWAHGYVTDSFSLDGVKSYGLNQANHASGVSGFSISPVTSGRMLQIANYQLVLDKPIPKTNLNTMAFTTRISWNRYIPPTP